MSSMAASKSTLAWTRCRSSMACAWSSFRCPRHTNVLVVVPFGLAMLLFCVSLQSLALTIFARAYTHLISAGRIGIRPFSGCNSRSAVSRKKRPRCKKLLRDGYPRFIAGAAPTVEDVFTQHDRALPSVYREGRPSPRTVSAPVAVRQTTVETAHCEHPIAANILPRRDFASLMRSVVVFVTLRPRRGFPLPARWRSW